MNRLAAMAAHSVRRVERLMREEPVEALRARGLYARPPLDASAACAPGAVVAEVAFADPERGLLVPRELATAAEAAARVRSALEGGADAAAVWVERHFHAGDWSHLEAARAALPGAILIARDLVVDPWQLERARAAGADAIELIPELLGGAFAAMAGKARALGLAPLVVDRERRWFPAESLLA